MPLNLVQNTILPENPAIDTEFIILENIYDSANHQLPLRQRELAQIAGASLGMTNSILKRLAQKGWITVKKLNSRNIQYAVTLDGINEIIGRSYRYFKRTIRNVVFYKDILEEVMRLASSRNIGAVVLVGKSDLDFIVEHACRLWGLGYRRVGDETNSRLASWPGTLKVYAESIPEDSSEDSIEDSGTEIGETDSRSSPVNTFYLSRLIIRQAANVEAAGYAG